LETNISGDAVRVVAPTAGSEVTEGSVPFVWDVLDGADRYRMTIVNPSFENAGVAVMDTVVYSDSLALSLTLRKKLQQGSYEWSLQAFNQAYQSVRSVYGLVVVAPETPELPTEPENGNETGHDDETVEPETATIL
jgi:hypothetical protein